MKISVVSPVYKAETMLDELVSRISDSVGNLTEDFEIILVEDGGPDRSWEKIDSICKANPKVKGIKLSRNFGQHYAITAGLEAAAGEWIVVMDCDLQDRPEEIPLLFAETKKGYDLVFARRISRQDGLLKRFSSLLFYKVFGFLTDTRQDPSIANFGIYRNEAIRAILEMKDYIRYFPTMAQWVGFRKGYVDVSHASREDGKSSYSWGKLFSLAFNNILAFSDKPLRLTIQFGLLISLFSGVLGLVYLYKYIIGDIFVLGFASLIISIWFLSGAIIFILGVVGMYVGKTFEKVKGRPVYIIEKKINIEQ